MADWTLFLGSWTELGEYARPVRIAVFLVEQAVPEDMEWDEFDALSRHAVVFDSVGQPIATGRLLPNGHIGRMAVLKDRRCQGIGSAVLAALIAEADVQGMGSLQLHAQTHAMPFYERAGFKAEGPEFMEAGIPHVLMGKHRPA